MRILFTNTGSWGTGSFFAIEAIADELLRQGHEVKIFFPDSGCSSTDNCKYYSNPRLYDIWRFPVEENKVFIPTFPLMIPDPHPRNPNPITFKELSSEQLELYLFDCGRKLRKVIEEFRPDAIECQHIWAMDSVVNELGYPHISTAHNSDQMGFRYATNMRDVAKKGAQTASYIFTCAEHLKENIINFYDVPDSKIVTIYNGYDHNIFRQKATDRRQFLHDLGVNIPDEAPIVTFSGKLSFTKGIDILVKAMQLLRNKGVHFLIFGSGTLEPEIADELSHCTAHPCHFLGHQPQPIIAKAHNIAKVSVAPSREEGFPLACLEAMACGAPVVTTANIGFDEHIVGKLFEAENHEKLAEAIMELIFLPEIQYNELSLEAKDMAENFSWRKATAKRLEYYRELKNEL